VFAAFKKESLRAGRKRGEREDIERGFNRRGMGHKIGGKGDHRGGQKGGTSLKVPDASHNCYNRKMGLGLF